MQTDDIKETRYLYHEIIDKIYMDDIEENVKDEKLIQIHAKLKE